MVDDLALRNTESILEHRQKHEISMGYCNFANYEAKFIRMVIVTFREKSNLFSRVLGWESSDISRQIYTC